LAASTVPLVLRPAESMLLYWNVLVAAMRVTSVR
jgi:hypothetical protein